jgi:hypothetical protein
LEASIGFGFLADDHDLVSGYAANTQVVYPGKAAHAAAQS